MTKNIADAIVFLLKYVKNRPKYIKDFKNGNLYFTKLQYFNDLENKENNDKTGDKNESKFHWEINDLKSLTIAGHKINPEDITKISLDLEMNSIDKDNCGICSFFAVYFRDLEKDKDNENVYRIKPKVKEDLQKLKDGDRKLFVVKNVKGLIRESNEYQIEHGSVIYYDPNNYEINKVSTNHLMFYKTNKYKYQHEYRFVKNNIGKGNLVHFDSLEKNILEIKFKIKEN
ncbi:hypothetical protein [Lactobacillus helsingborgensis]|uniref:hypothetical protein n=1 Tax=Lactobacillus helsingborgensis TaxID=1218494 RepID=UPI0022655FF9|nr:hypothetical protein [Lactobacillus helsingborgensis]UZX32006.1 hypothetical protein LDX52_02900 [Lactobacillus helsingborgensis]